MDGKMEIKHKPKKCKHCGNPFIPLYNTTQQACSIPCAQAIGRKNGTKRRVAQYRIDKEKLKSRSDWLKECQVLYNRLIRLMDAERYEKYGCISCGSKTGKLNAGHYRSVGSAPELRFSLDPLNCWIQCEHCNTHLSANLILYRKNLVSMGIDIDYLESKHEAKHYSIPDIKELIAQFKLKIQELNKHE